MDVWSSELEDISLVKELTALEICSLSLNNVKTLKYFANSRVPDYFDWIADIFGASSGIGLRYFIGFKLK